MKQGTQAAPTAAVIGAGPAGLMAAEVLARAGLGVTVYDRMPAPGRKFLLAGRGGLNLTHSEELARFLFRYREAAPRLRAAIEAFPPSALRTWAEELGQETFVGTSGRVFPKAMKASPLLRAWLVRLAALKAMFKARHRWAGWDADGKLLFDTPAGRIEAAADVTVFALGGASWPRLGSDGNWTALFAARGIAISPLKPSNCGFVADFSDLFRARFEGQPLKGIELHFEGESVRGEATVTKTGLEGGAIYALSPPLRDAIERGGQAILTADLRPGLPAARAGARTRQAARQAVVLEFPAQGGQAFARGHRAAARGHTPEWRAAIVHDAGGARRADKGRARSPHRNGRHRAGHFDRGRSRVRRSGREFHAAAPAGRVRRGRNAGLGGANRRLSPAGVLFDRSGGGKRSNRVA